MLVLSRKPQQKVIINNGAVIVTVLEIAGDYVRLGFDADVSIPIYRAEIQRRVDRAKDEPVDRFQEEQE